MFDLWSFLTVTVIVWGIVEVIQYSIKSKRLSQPKEKPDYVKSLEGRVLQLEKRIGNLETVLVEQDADDTAESGASHSSPEPWQPGKLSNQLQNKK